MSTEPLKFSIIAKDEFSKTFDSVSKGLKKVEKYALIAAGGISAAGGALFAMAKTTATAYDQIGKFSDQTNLSTEFLSKMGVAAHFTDIDIGTMNRSLERLQIGIGEASKGIGTAKDVLGDLGISLNKSNGDLKTTEDILPELADRFKNMTDATMKSEMAQKLFGQRGMEMIKILNTGSEGLANFTKEAENMGLVVDKAAAKKAAEFNDALYRVQGSLKGVKDAIGVELMPFLTTLANQFAEFIQKNRADIVSWGKDLAGVFGAIAEAGARSTAFIIDAWHDLRVTWAGTVAKAREMYILFNTLGAEENEKDKARNDEKVKYIQAARARIKELEDKQIEDYSSARAAELNIQKNTLEKLEKNTDESLMRRQEMQQNYVDAINAYNELLANPPESKKTVDDFIKNFKERLEAQKELTEKFNEEKIETETENEENIIVTKAELRAAEIAQALEDHEAYENQKYAVSSKTVDKTTEKEKKAAADKIDLQKQTFSKLAAIGKSFGKIGFRASQAAHLAEIYMSTKGAMVKALEQLGPTPWGYAAAAAAFLYGTAQAADVAKQTYAHGGMTRVPNETTMTVTAGERIISPKQNQDLTEFLKNKNSGGTRIDNINIEILPNATNAEALLSLSRDVWKRITEDKIIPALSSLKLVGVSV